MGEDSGICQLLLLNQVRFKSLRNLTVFTLRTRPYLYWKSDLFANIRRRRKIKSSLSLLCPFVGILRTKENLCGRCKSRSYCAEEQRSLNDDLKTKKTTLINKVATQTMTRSSYYFVAITALSNIFFKELRIANREQHDWLETLSIRRKRRSSTPLPTCDRFSRQHYQVKAYCRSRITENVLDRASFVSVNKLIGHLFFAVSN